MNDFVIGVIAAFVPAFLSAVLILVLEKCVSSRIAKNERTIARHNKEMDGLKLAQRWAYSSFATLSESMAILENLLKQDVFAGVGDGGVVNLDLKLPLLVQEMDLNQIDTACVELKDAALKLEHDIELHNETVGGFRGLYGRVVDLCYSNDWTLINSLNFRNNTNRDFHKIEKDIFDSADRLRREFIEYSYTIEAYFDGIRKLEPRKRHWWVNFSKKVEDKKGGIKINITEVSAKAGKFMSRIESE